MGRTMKAERFFFSILLALLLGAVVAFPVLRAEEKGKKESDAVLHGKIQQTLLEGVKFLMSKRAKDGLWYYSNKMYPMGTTALVLYALTLSGISPKDPVFVKALEGLLKFVDKLKVDKVTTYELGLSILCLEAVDRKKYATQILKLKKVLMDRQTKSGGWDYRKPTYMSTGRKTSQRTDWSNTQFAVLGLAAAMRAEEGGYVFRRRRAPDHWLRLREYILNTYLKNYSGWPYCPTVADRSKLRPTPSMTAAAIASTLLTYSSLNNTRRFPCGSDRALLDLVDAGLAYFEKNPRLVFPTRLTSLAAFATYRMYAIERVGFYTGLRKIGGIDWFRVGAKLIMSAARANGGWKDIPGAAFAVLFLSKGRWPIVIQKLKWGKGWNDCPLDLLRLTEKASEAFERKEIEKIVTTATAYMPTPRVGKRCTWVTLTFDTPFEKWLEIPMLLLSGQKFPAFTEEQEEMLYRYAMSGGLIIADTCVGSRDFDEGFRKFVARKFPGYELKLLPRDHPIYSSWYRVYVPLEGFVGPHGRLMALYCPEGMSAEWESGNPGSKGSRMGVNIIKYVTDNVPGIWH